MAMSALRAGIPTIVWNRTLEATRDLADLGAEVAETAADTARRAAIVVTMVTNADAVLSIASEKGMLAALAPGAIWVQMSTIGVAGIDRVAALVEVERPDVLLLDAPVSGSKEPAEQGNLTIFASGPDEARERVNRALRRPRPVHDLGRSRSKTCTWPSRRPTTTGSSSLPAWPTSGNRLSIAGSAMRTSQS